MLSPRVLGVATVILLACTLQASRYDGYHLINLGSLLGGRAYTIAVSDNLTAVGMSYDSFNGGYPFFWANGTLTPIGNGTPNSINVLGRAVGGTNAWMWEGANQIDISPPGSISSEAMGVNDTGQIVGNFLTSQNNAFILSGAQYTTIPPIRVGGYCRANAINASGDVVGMTATGGTYRHAFKWTNGTTVDLGSLMFESEAKAINDLGVAVGSCTFSGGRRHPCVFSDGTIVDLLPAWAQYSFVATGINNAGQIIGTHGSNGYIYEDGQWLALPDVIDESGAGYVIGVTYNITNKGYIAAEELVSGTNRAFVLIPFMRNQVSSEALYRGRLIGGVLSNIEQHDATYVLLQPGFTLNSQEAPVALTATATSSFSNPADLRVKVRAHASTPGLTEFIELWDFTSAAWKPVSAGAATTSDSLMTGIAQGAARFTESGSNLVKVRVSWKATGPVLSYPWTIAVDEVVVNSTP